ncbi:MAG: 1,4-alpha-glucan branching protein GlgB [Clostridia bacterium]
MNVKNIQDYNYLGANRFDKDRFVFRVYAPNAYAVYLFGTFNNWDYANCPLKKDSDGVWSVITKATDFDQYKFVIETNQGIKYKADPYAKYSQTRGSTNSIVFESLYEFCDARYINKRTCLDKKPVNIYEMHLGSWRRHNGIEYNYRELAPLICNYCKKMSFNYVEFLPLAEYPLDDSWGYQVTGFFSPTSRYGNPDDLKYLVDTLHANDIGVILDFVPAHFCKDEFGLIEFDGSCLYESQDQTRREHKSWGTNIFDYAKPQVVDFLISCAIYWLREFHFDGLRVDAVASMLYLDYDRADGEWNKNIYGGNYNLEAIDFLRKLSNTISATCPNCILIAEESTAFNKVTGSTCQGGLGFDFKWNMGWMNDTLSYFCAPFDKRYEVYNKLTFPLMYSQSEKYILPFSHDEVVHGKCSLIGKLPGDYQQKFRGLKTLSALLFAQVGKKLNFMGNELAQFIEWNPTREVDWLLLDYASHKDYLDYFARLGNIYLSHPSLFELDYSPDGFIAIQANDNNGVLAFLRKSSSQTMLCVFNFSQDTRSNYTLYTKYGLAKFTCIMSTDQMSSFITDNEGKITLDLLPLSANYYLLD